MKRVAVGTASVVLLAALAAAYVEGVVPGTDGCVLRSADKDEYVRRNEAVLRGLRLPPALRQAHINTWTHAIPATNQCIPVENGPPYSNFITTYVLRRQPQPGRAPLGFDVRVLGRRWVQRPHGSGSESFCNGPASLHVDPSDEGLLLKVDYRGCAGDRSLSR